MDVCEWRGRLCCVQSSDKTLMLWDMRTGQCGQVFEGRDFDTCRVYRAVTRRWWCGTWELVSVVKCLKVMTLTSTVCASTQAATLLPLVQMMPRYVHSSCCIISQFVDSCVTCRCLRCDATHIAVLLRPPVRHNIEVSGSHRLEIFKNNFTFS